MSKSKRISGNLNKLSDDIIWMREKRQKLQKEENLYEQAKEMRRAARNLKERVQNIDAEGKVQ